MEEEKNQESQNEDQLVLELKPPPLTHPGSRRIQKSVGIIKYSKQCAPPGAYEDFAGGGVSDPRPFFELRS